MGQKVEERVVANDEAGERFDRWIARVTGLSRQRAMRLFDEGRVRVAGRTPRKGDVVEAGWRVSIAHPASELPVPEPESPLPVLYEDEDLIAVDKPAGVSMHPLRPGEAGTLANAVVARFPDVLEASPEKRCPGLVHRLDRDTSGVVLWARRRKVWDGLRGQFSAQTVTKRYLALVHGRLDGEGEISVPIAHHPKNPRRMVAVPDPEGGEALKAREALTRYRVLAASKSPLSTQSMGVETEGTSLAVGEGESVYTLVEVYIITGVRHQIRVHLSSLGHPVAGDVLYGGAAVPGMERHWLHAESIGFLHPGTGEAMTLRAPLPRELDEVLRRVGIVEP